MPATIATASAWTITRSRSPDPTNIHSGATILPIAHWGGENFLRNLARFKRTDFHICVGDPFRLKLDGVKVTREIRQQIAPILDPDRESDQTIRNARGGEFLGSETRVRRRLRMADQCLTSIIMILCSCSFHLQFYLTQALV